MTDSQALELVPEPVNPSVLLERMLFEMRKVIVGQDRAIERMLVCLLANGHCLLESVPGLAKTLSVETMARTVGGTFNRICLGRTDTLYDLFNGIEIGAYSRHFAILLI